MKNVVLIGMMGCGKSSVGRVLAQRLGMGFADTDQCIEAALGRSIPEIFATEGEAFFRDWELGVAEELARKENLVIACGGGLPTRPDAIASLKYSGTGIFLDRDGEDIYDHVSMDHRPLGQAGREAFLERCRQREPVYRQWAEHIIPSRATAQETAQAVLEALQL